MTSPCDEDEAPLMPVRRLHNFVYCPRLFYLQWVEGIFVPNEDTVRGSALHGRVDEPTKLKRKLWLTSKEHCGLLHFLQNCWESPAFPT